MPTKQKTESSNIDQQPNIGLDAMPDLSALQAAGFNNMTSFGTAWVETFSNMGSEMLSFVADRFKEDVKTQHEILHCDDMAELQKIQARFIQKAVDQYSAETSKLVEMSQQLFPKASKKTD